jgi:hypothetical protein
VIVLLPADPVAVAGGAPQDLEHLSSTASQADLRSLEHHTVADTRFHDHLHGTSADVDGGCQTAVLPCSDEGRPAAWPPKGALAQLRTMLGGG